MEKIDRILPRALKKKGLLSIAGSAQICFYADEWASKRFETISFCNGVLKVFAKSPSAASEIQMLEEELIQYLNEKLGRKSVRKIKIVTNKL